jgi:hypothetical protein
MKLLGLLLLAAGMNAQDLRGVVDLHCHAGPDAMARSIDGVALARLAKERGLRGIVLKNHFEPTTAMAYLARQQAPGLEVFGGIALNRPLGGVNPSAVEHMVKMTGGVGRVVWMPTFDAENQVRGSGEKGPYVSISRNGELLPEVLAVLDLIARHRLLLATGHSSAAEVLLLARAARERGVAGTLVTHPMGAPVNMSISQMKDAASVGAFLEFQYNALIGTKPAFKIGDFVSAIREIGPAHCVLTSDLGQAGNPLHPDGLVTYFRLLRDQGFRADEIDRMAKVNPARLLGLPPF